MLSISEYTERMNEIALTICPSLNDDMLVGIALKDALVLKQKNAEYGDSWKKRGGVDSYYMLTRKWDRIEAQVEKNGGNILELAVQDERDEGLLDDIADLRRYLLLVEHEVQLRRTRRKKFSGTVAEVDGEVTAHGYVDQDGSG